VNETFAKKNFADENPIGQHLALPRSCGKCEIEIVGVSSNVLYGGVKERVWPIVCLPFTQGVWGPAQGIAYQLRCAPERIKALN